jgi:hypothetical protein
MGKAGKNHLGISGPRSKSGNHQGQCRLKKGAPRFGSLPMMRGVRESWGCVDRLFLGISGGGGEDIIDWFVGVCHSGFYDCWCG